MADGGEKLLLELEMKDAGRLQAIDAADLQDWIQKECSFWEWLPQVLQKNIGVAQDDRRNKLWSSLSAAKSHSQNLSGPDAPNALMETNRHLQVYGGFGLASPGPRAQFVASLRERYGDLVASAAVAEFLGAVWNNLSTVPIDHRYQASLGRTAMRFFDLEAGTPSAEAALGTARQLLATYSRQLRVETEKSLGEREANRRQYEQLMSDVSSDRQDSQAKWAAFLETSSADIKKEIESLKATGSAFKEQMKLRAAVQYWTKKGVDHRTAARWQCFWAILFAAVSTVAAYWSIAQIFESALKLAMDLQEKATTPLILLAGSALLISSALIWIGRLLVRVYFDERQRSLDAFERATMAETYSALTHEGLISEQERIVVLKSLFRPIGESSGQEDGGPETLQQFVVKLLDQKPGGK